MTAQVIAFPYKVKPRHYILQNGIPTPCHNKLRWLEWMEQHDHRHVLQQEWNDVVLVTTFCGIDKGTWGSAAPWQTRIVAKELGHPLHGLYWHFSDESDAHWFHDYVACCITTGQHRPRQLYDELMKLLPENDSLFLEGG